MAYRFNLDEKNAGKNIRRIAQEQIKKAHKQFNKREEMHLAFLEARKSFKKVRALMALGNGPLTKKTISKEKKQLQTLARKLAPARDYQAMLEMLIKLEVALEGNLSPKLVKKLRKTLIAQREKQQNSLTRKKLIKVQKQLEGQSARFRKLKTKSGKMNKVFKSYAHDYAKGQDHLAKALKSGKAYDLHEWRKTVTLHRRQSQLLADYFPSEMLGRAGYARSVAKLLGAHQDLYLLKQFAKENQTKLKLNKKQANVFFKGIKEQLADLERYAIARGRRLYFLPTKIVQNQMKLFAQTLDANHPLPLVALNLDENEQDEAERIHKFEDTSAASSEGKTETKWVTYPYESQTAKRLKARKVKKQEPKEQPPLRIVSSYNQ